MSSLAQRLSSLALLIASVRGDTEYCYNEDSCADTTVNATSTDCYGYYACEDSDVSCTYGYDFGAYSNYDADCDDKYLFGYGMMSHYYADVATYAMYAYGYLTAYEADIEPLESSLYLYFYGYYSGYYADVLCYSGDTCQIYCGASYGCAELSYYCYSGATCYYDCEDDSDYCPTLYSGVESQVVAVKHVSQSPDSKTSKLWEAALTDAEITERYVASRARKDAKKGKENVEELMAMLTQKSDKSGFAKMETVDTSHMLQLNSMNQRTERVQTKQERKRAQLFESRLQRYGKAMAIEGVLLLVLFGVYNLYFKNRNSKQHGGMLDNEDSPLLTNGGSRAVL